MEITKYTDFIKEQFNEIIENYKLVFIAENNYVVKMNNNKIEILLFTEYRKNDILSTTIADKRNEQYFTIVDIVEKKIRNNSYLTENDKQKCKSFNDKIKAAIYVDSLILKNHCQDLLNGDFSSLE